MASSLKLKKNKKEQAEEKKKKSTKKENPFEKHRERVKEDFLKRDIKSLSGMSEHRALELLLFFALPRIDTAQVARNLITTFGSFHNTVKASYGELLKVTGVGPNAAMLLKVIPAIASYYEIKSVESKVCIKNSEEAYRVFKPYFQHCRNEELYIICLDGNKRFLGIANVGEGGLLSAGVNMRRIVTEAIQLSAVYIYVAHNHVTGPIDASGEDWVATEKMMRALHPLDIYILDHLIIGQEGSASLRRLGAIHRVPLSWPVD